jgi:hypothetical protein
MKEQAAPNYRKRKSKEESNLNIGTHKQPFKLL